MASDTMGTSDATKYTVMVTGFGANKHHTNKASNPAGEIAKIMPSSFAADDALNVSGVDIHLLREGIPEGWTVMPATFSAIRQAIKEMHEKLDDQVDLWIHLGRMGDHGCYTCERRAYSQDFSSSWGNTAGYYKNLDNDDQTAHTIGPNPWAGKVPLGIVTDLNVNSIVAGADGAFKKYLLEQDSKRENLPYIRSHVEAGEAGCGFAFYESLANCWVSKTPGNVLFCHVPFPVDKETIETGRDAILAIIGASVASMIEEARKPPPPVGAPSKMRRRFYDEL